MPNAGGMLRVGAALLGRMSLADRSSRVALSREGGLAGGTRVSSAPFFMPNPEKVAKALRELAEY
jgi:hypothetical protein